MPYVVVRVRHVCVVRDCVTASFVLASQLCPTAMVSERSSLVCMCVLSFKHSGLTRCCALDPISYVSESGGIALEQAYPYRSDLDWCRWGWRGRGAHVGNETITC